MKGRFVMEIGKKIRQLRVNKGLTQESLAKALGVSYQAVSRWENEMSMPDITLLPAISTFFGVSIDELFEFTEESQMERISNMIVEKDELPDFDFENAKRFLETKVRDSKNIQAIQMLATLYEHRANSFKNKAIEYAKKAIENGGSNKNMNNILRDGYNVFHSDWNLNNHHELIHFYEEYLNNNSNNLIEYGYYISALVADGRLEEATYIVDKIRSLETPERIFQYELLILRTKGHIQEAEELIKKMLDQFSDSWFVWAVIADFKAFFCKYDDAIACYIRSYELQTKPRYTDSLEAIAHIYEIKGEIKEAVLTYQNILDLLNEDWNVTFGVTVNKYLQKINELKKG